MSGLTVLLTRETTDNVELAECIRNLGGEVVESPLIQILQRPDALFAFINSGAPNIEEGFRRWFSRFDGLVVTSANALRALRDVFERFPNLASVLPCFVVGARSAKVAQRLGLTTIHPPGVRTAHDLAEHLAQERDSIAQTFQQTSRSWLRLLWLRGSLADLSFKHVVEEAGGVVEDVVCYDTVVLPVSEAAWEEVRVGNAVVVFYSPSAVSAYVSSPAVQENPPEGELDVLAIGPTTAGALRDAGFTRVVMAPEPGLEGVIDTLAEINRLKINQRRGSNESTR